MPTSYGFIQVQLAVDLLDKVFDSYDVKDNCWLRHHAIKHGDKSYCAKLIVWVAKTGQRPPDGMQIKLTCGSTTCIKFEHMQLVPMSSNSKRAKLEPEQVREIRASKLTSTQLAKKFRVAISTISDIRRGHSYKHIN